MRTQIIVVLAVGKSDSAHCAGGPMPRPPRGVFPPSHTPAKGDRSPLAGVWGAQDLAQALGGGPPVRSAESNFPRVSDKVSPSPHLIF